MTRARQAALMGARDGACDPGDKPCPMTPDQIVKAMREDLDGLSETTLNILAFTTPIDRKDCWRQWHRDARNTPKINGDWVMSPCRRAASNSITSRSSVLQLEEARIAHTFACYLADRVNELAGQPFQTKEFGTLDVLPMCPPYSDTFVTAEKILKLPDTSRLPADFLKAHEAVQP